MAPSAIAGIIADRLDRPLAVVEGIQAEISRAGILPRDTAEAAATVLLATLMGATPDTAAATAMQLIYLRNEDGRDAPEFVGTLLRSLMNIDDRTGFPAGLAYRAAVRAELGDGPAVTVRFSCDDGAEEIAFTDDAHGYAPDRDMTIGLTLSCPGRVLFRIAFDLAHLQRLPPGVGELVA